MARAGNTRDGGGVPIRLAVTAPTEHAAREELKRRAMSVGSGVAVTLTKRARSPRPSTSG
ncbi:hypothetical protein GCM10025870_31500 [Agromyces marinus]|uniref:Uncharacterized protein n=1 Tax=Agromyces marinus TaxID=1389020 RepID=A0ABM8H5J5_9MICO|nr:hypothetical protein GCM10025870_31500 [Agromyces marinus]